MSRGSCKVCESSLAKQMNKRIARGDSYTKLIAWAADNDFPVTKPTLLNHKRHITDPKTTVVEEARRNPAIKRVNHDEFLQSLVDMAAAKASANPDDVSIDQGIRAASTLSARGDRRIDVLVMLAERLAPKEIIEGEWEELPALVTREN